MIYFDNAATTYPKPAEVERAVKKAFRKYGANPGRSGHKLSLQTAQMVYQTREETASFFNFPDCNQVIFTSNCTHSLNFAIKGFLKKGDHVIVTGFEHNSVMRPLEEMKRRGLIRFSVAQVYEGNDEKTVEEFESKVRPDTAAVVMTHASNVFGILTPVKKIARRLKPYGVKIIVDAAQSAGIIPIDLKDGLIDCLCAPGHKGLYGPPGTGILILCSGTPLETIFEGGTGSRSVEMEQPAFLPDRFESGTLNTVGIAGLYEGLRAVERQGIECLYEREMALCRQAYEGLLQVPGAILYTEPPKKGVHVPVLSFNLKGWDSEQTAEALSEAGIAVRAGYHCSPLAHQSMGTIETGTVRISFGMHNTSREIESFLNAVKKL